MAAVVRRDEHDQGEFPLSMLDVEAAMRFAQELVQQAGLIALQHFRQPLDVANKLGDGRFDPVTVADREVERFLSEGIRARYPDHGIVGEEHGTLAGASPWSWIIDPIDGTRAFISGVPAWGTLLGLRHGERCVAGLMHQPYLEESFLGTPQGAWLLRRGEQRALRTRATAALKDAILYCTHPSIFPDAAELADFERVAAHTRLMRYGGDCYSYCLLALGQIDLVIEGGLQAYDIQPLIPIIEAAGGVVSGRHGEDASGGGFVVAAANAALHREALSLLNP
jgi:histidinol phosphatase-like enzyme (inositol monophosphatase family)